MNSLFVQKKIDEFIEQGTHRSTNINSIKEIRNVFWFLH